MSEPAIIAFGRSHVGDYTSEEYLASLRSAFGRGGADFVVLDSNMAGQRFLAAATAWALDAGLLFNDKNSDDRGMGDEQSVVSSFRLTTAGRERLGLGSK
jgi:hypothetical protein